MKTFSANLDLWLATASVFDGFIVSIEPKIFGKLGISISIVNSTLVMHGSIRVANNFSINMVRSLYDLL